MVTIENGVLKSSYVPGESVTIPDGVTSLGYSAFWGKKGLHSVVMPDSVTEIGMSAFRRCEYLTSINIPDSVTTIGETAFADCYSLPSITIPNSVTSIGDGAFGACRSLTSVTIPDSVTSMGLNAFGGCYSLTSVHIGGGLDIIPVSAFANCGMTSVTFSNGVTTIEDHAFYHCTNLASLTLPDSLTTIGTHAFEFCNLTSVTIPQNVTTIKNSAFANCGSLASVTIPSSVTSIENYAFNGCTALKDIYYGGTEAQWKAIKIEDGYFGYFFPGTITVHYNGTTTPTQPQQPAAETIASPTNDKLEVNGAAQDPTVYKIGGSNYFKIRDVAAVLNGTEKQFAVGYSGGKVTVTSGQPYEATGKELAGAPAAAKEASPSKDAIVIDGVETGLTVYKIGGSNYFKLRDLGKALNFYVGWEAGRGVYIETGKPYSK